MNKALVAVACTLLTAIGFYFSIGLGEQWWLAWLAPIPVLWFAYGDSKGWQAFLAAWVACALGASNILKAYGGILPAPVMVLSLAGPSLLFALSVLGSKIVARRIGLLAGVLTFAALWAGFDFLLSFNSAGGSVATLALAEVSAPALIQIASLVGAWGVTFLLGFVAAGLAAALQSRSILPATLAVAAFALNAAFGFARMADAHETTLRVGLIDTDAMQRAVFSDNRKDTSDTVDGYVQAIRALKGKGVRLIVLPEKLAIARRDWDPALKAKFANSAREVGAVVVAGFDARDGAKSWNVSWAFTPQSDAPTIYTKRRLVPGLETRYTIGPGPLALSDGTGLEICKDMDFQAMIRDDMVATKPRLLAVPAWDFVADAVAHARAAILRSVENGVPMARSARNGLLTLNDRYGRVVAMKVTGGEGFVTLVGELPLDGRGGETLYDRIGDAFGWLCVLLGAGLVGFAFAGGARRQP
jgi:apolipoprotein N-acyltransferase